MGLDQNKRKLSAGYHMLARFTLVEHSGGEPNLFEEESANNFTTSK